MRSFECLITDSRFSVRQLTWFIVQDEVRACELGRLKLQESPHHEHVEVREGERIILVAGRGHQPEPRTHGPA